MQIGQINTLSISRQIKAGFILQDVENNEVLLPNYFCTAQMKIGDPVDVFIYLDGEERLTATTETPKIKMHEFAYLKALQVNQYGAFMDWGLSKDLFIPFAEQRQRMEEGQYYTIFLDFDETTGRLYGSSKISRFLSDDKSQLSPGEKVKVLLCRQTDMGITVIVNNAHMGLIYKNEIFGKPNLGSQTDAYIKTIREDGKLDISLQALGYKSAIIDQTSTLQSLLSKYNGFIALTDKSSPEEIYRLLGMSKKAFKRAVGDLYRKKKIQILPEGIKAV